VIDAKREQNFKLKYERLAREIAKRADIIIKEIRYKEIIMDVVSDVRLRCSKREYGYKNRIQVTFIGSGVGAQNFNATRKNTVNRILKTNAEVFKKCPVEAHQIIITFNVNPHNM